MVFKDYYKILDLETSRVSLEEIKVAYRQAAKKYHPDVNIGDKLAEEKIKDINEAYRVLSIPSQKRKYDRTWSSRSGVKNKKVFSLKDENSSIVNMFLGNVEKQEKRNIEKPVKGENVETQIEANIYETFYGQEKKIALKDVDGTQRKLTIQIPKGIQSGEKIRLIGQGLPGKNGGKNGDLFIQIKIQKDNAFTLYGNDIYTKVLLTPWEAALGAKVDVKGIDEDSKVYIPQGIQSGEKIRIPNKGYINSNDNSRGDLIVEVQIAVPKKLSQDEKNAFEKLSKISNFNPRN